MNTGRTSTLATAGDQSNPGAILTVAGHLAEHPTEPKAAPGREPASPLLARRGPLQKIADNQEDDPGLGLASKLPEGPHQPHSQVRLGSQPDVRCMPKLAFVECMLSCLPRAFIAPKRKTPHRLVPMRGSILGQRW
jgi:hypothetical protein